MSPRSTLGPFVLLLLLCAPVAAERIYTAPTGIVATHAEIVVRARVDLETRRAQLLATYRGQAPETFVVRNLRDFADAPQMPGSRGTTQEAILFLDELDGRYYLVRTSSPAWIRPHAAILYLTRDGKVLQYGQLLSGVLRLAEMQHVTWKELERALAAWLAKPRAPTVERPSPKAEEGRTLYALIDPYVDLHRREVVAEPDPHRLVRVLAGLGQVASEQRGELRRRAIEALLVLAQQWGPDQSRRGMTEARLTRLLGHGGAEPFVEPCLDEIRSPAVCASRRTAARLLRKIGGEPQARAKAVLLEILAQDRRTLGTEAYYALRFLGFPGEADRALQTASTKRR